MFRRRTKQETPRMGARAFARCLVGVHMARYFYTSHPSDGYEQAHEALVLAIHKRYPHENAYDLVAEAMEHHRRAEEELDYLEDFSARYPLTESVSS